MSAALDALLTLDLVDPGAGLHMHWPAFGSSSTQHPCPPLPLTCRPDVTLLDGPSWARCVAQLRHALGGRVSS